MSDQKDKYSTEFQAIGVDKVAGGFASISREANQLTRTLGSIVGVTGAVSAALGAIGGALTARKVAEIGSAYESVQARLAGTLSALEFSPDFLSGLKDAQGVMKQLYSDAAKLPGEAEDYVEVFVANLPVLSQALPGGGLKEFTAFSNKYVAVAKSLQVETGLASMELTRMLGAGHAMIDSRSPAFRALLPFMQKVQGHAGMLAADFNKLSQTARADLLGKALERMDPMVKQMSTSWSAVEGAVSTAGRTLFRESSSPLFASMKTSMQSVADLITDSSGELTRFGQIVSGVGQAISRQLGGALDRVAVSLGEIGANSDKWLNSLRQSPVVGMIDGMLGRMQAVGQGMVGKGGAGANAVAGAGAGAVVAGPMGALVGALIGFKNLGRIAGTLADAFVKVVEVVGPAAQSIGVFVSQSVDSFVSSLLGLTPIIVELADTAGHFLTAMLPVIDVTRSVGEALGAVIPALALSLQGWSYIFDYVLNPAMRFFASMIEGLALMVQMVAAFVSFVYRSLTLNAKEFDASQADRRMKAAEEARKKSSGESGGPLGQLLAKLAGYKLPDLDAAGRGAPKLPKPPSARPEGHTVQDFRGSRFTIQQDFDKNFDPDRIAVAFAKDVERIGTKRLQSGFEPLFGVV